jgi:hypothetical protein
VGPPRRLVLYLYKKNVKHKNEILSEQFWIKFIVLIMLLGKPLIPLEDGRS